MAVKSENKNFHQQWVFSFVLGLAGLSLVFLAGASTNVAAQDQTQTSVPNNAREVTAVFPANFPPHYQLDKKGRPGGFAIEMMAEIAKRAGIKIKYAPKKNWSETNNALRAGKADLIPNMGLTEKRKSFIAFTEPYETIHISLFIRETTTNIVTLYDLNERKIGAVKENAAIRLLQSQKLTDPRLLNFELKIYPDFPEVLFALLSGEIDAFAYPESNAWKLAKKAGVDNRIAQAGDPLLEIKRGIGVRKDDPVLLARLDKAVRAFVKTPRYQEIYTKWFATPPPYWTATRIVYVLGGGFIAILIIMAIWHTVTISRINKRVVSSLVRLHTLIDTTVDGVIMIDGQGIVQLYNNACEKLFDYPRKDVIGQNINMLMPSPDHEQHDGYLKHYQAIGEHKIIGIGRDVTGRRQDGSTFPLHLSVGEFKEGDDIYFVGMLHDLTHRKQVEAQVHDLRTGLQHAARISTVNQLAAALAHEINQPLAAIANYTLAARRTIEKGEDYDKGLDLLIKATEQSDRASQIIRRIRDFIHSDDGTFVEENFNQVVNEALEFALIGTVHEGIIVTKKLDESLPGVLMDKVQIQQVIVNLIRNALEAMKDSDSRTLTICTRNADEAGISFAVSDTGPGLTDEVAKNLFKPFTTSKVDGMGLGLSICKSIIDTHNGAIEAIPNNPKGITFRFTLPVQKS